MPPVDIDPFDSNSETHYAAFAQLRAKRVAQVVPSGQLFFVRQTGVEQGLKSVDHFVGSFGDVGVDREIGCVPGPGPITRFRSERRRTRGRGPARGP